MATKAKRRARPDVLIMRDLTARLRCGRTAVGRLLQRGKLRGVKIGACGWRVSETALANFLEGR